MSFGVRLKELREAKGWTRYRLAVEAGVATQVLDRLEADPDRDPQWATVRKLADALGVSTEEFRAETAPAKKLKKS